MDPLSALAIASAITQFLDIGLKIGKRLAEYNKASPNEVPRSLQSISRQLPLLINALQRVKTDAQVNSFDLDTQCILKGVISGCTNLVREVETILNKVAKAPGESLTSKVRKSLAGFKYDERILAIDRNLQTYISVLILHHVIDSYEVLYRPVEEVDYYEVKEKRADPFYDRNDIIQKLDELFYDAARSQVLKPSIVVLTGNTGVGKTQVALEYCRQAHHLGQFQTVFWLNARSPDSLTRSLEGTAAVIRRSTEGTQVEKLEFVKKFLSERWHPWLLVLDGYTHEAFSLGSVMNALPDRGYGAILVTSSQKSASALGDAIEVPKFLTSMEAERLKDDLRKAIVVGILGPVERCISRCGLIANGPNNQGEPFIAQAARLGKSSIVAALMKNGAAPNLLSALDVSSIVATAEAGASNILEMILNYEDVKGQRRGQEEYNEILKGVIDSGSPEAVNFLCSRRQTNLYENLVLLPKAARAGNADIVELILNHEDAKGQRRGQKEYDEMMIDAVEKGHLKIVETLCNRRQVDLNSKYRYGLSIYYWALRKGNADLVKHLLDHSGILSDDKENGRALCEAAKHGTVAALKILVGEKRIDPNLSDGCCTALHWAARSYAENNDMIEYLLEAGADPNVESQDRLSETPLHVAVEHGWKETKKVQLLLDHGGDLMKRDGWGRSAYLRAAQYNIETYDELMTEDIPDAIERTKIRNKALLCGASQGDRDFVLRIFWVEDEVDVNCTDSAGNTPLLLAVEGGHIEIVRSLIRYGARSDIAGSHGQLPLFAAVERNFDLIVRDLLKASKTPNQKNFHERTALCLAATMGYEKVVKVLLDAGADPEETDGYGDTPLDLAEVKGHGGVVRILDRAKLEGRAKLHGMRVDTG